MSHRSTKDHLDPKLHERIEKVEKHDHWIDHIFRRCLHILERVIALITLLALLAALGNELWEMFTVPGYLDDINNVLHHLLTVYVPVGEDTVLVWRYTELLFEELQVWQNVAITYTGHVLETYPARLTNVLRIELLNDSKELAVSPEPEPAPDVVTVVDIIDRTEHEPIVTADVLEGFWSDDEYTYYFGSLKSGLIIVHYSDGTQENVREAMGKGRVTLADLDRFGIGYYREEIVTAVDMECKEGVLDALELFWSDEEYDYFFPNMGTEVTVHLSDGHSWPLHDALMDGLVTVSDLDDYGIKYYKEPKE